MDTVFHPSDGKFTETKIVHEDSYYTLYARFAKTGDEWAEIVSIHEDTKNALSELKEEADANMEG